MRVRAVLKELFYDALNCTEEVTWSGTVQRDQNAGRERCCEGRSG